MTQQNDQTDFDVNEFFDFEAAEAEFSGFYADHGSIDATMPERTDTIDIDNTPDETMQTGLPLDDDADIAMDDSIFMAMMNEPLLDIDGLNATIAAMSSPDHITIADQPSVIEPHLLTTAAGSALPTQLPQVAHETSGEACTQDIPPEILQDLEPPLPWPIYLGTVENPNHIECPECKMYILPDYVTFPNYNEMFIPPHFMLCHMEDQYDYVGIAAVLADLFKSSMAMSARKYNSYKTLRDQNALMCVDNQLMQQLRPALTSIRVALEQFFAACMPDARELRAAVVAALLDPATSAEDWISDHHP